MNRIRIVALAALAVALAVPAAGAAKTDAAGGARGEGQLTMIAWEGYAQDQWVFHERYTMNLGVRAEHVNGFNPDSTGGGGRWETAVTTFPTQSDLVNLTTVAPRLGLVWDVHTQVAGWLRSKDA